MIGVLSPSKGQGLKYVYWNNIVKHNLKHIHSHQVLTNERFINHSKINHHIVCIFIHKSIQNTALKYAYTA